LYFTPNRWGECIALSNIGVLLDDMGRTTEAIEFLEQCVAMMETLGHLRLGANRTTLDRVRAKLAAS
jgi:hypothetical protein